MEQIPEMENFIKDFATKLGWPDASVSIKDSQDETLEVSLSVYDAKLLIGSKGKNLEILEHLLKALLIKKFGVTLPIRIDVNNYRRERVSYLKEVAHSAAQQVSQTKKPFALPPMNAFERKVVHTELASRPDVITESEGEEKQRHIVVKSYEL
jgi:spoIIIJ-associated protein